jgi:hypothetical protein
MKKVLFILFLGLFNILLVKSQECTKVFTDNFSSSAGWQSQGSGAVNVSNGKCNYANVYDGSYNRVYKSIGTTLSDNYWRAESNFTILNANPSGNGSGDIVMALTAGTLDFLSYDASQSYTETNQDGIGVIIGSMSSSTDNNINDWSFVIEAKKGNVRTWVTTGIFASLSISKYYIQLERTAKGMTQLSVFSDSTFTTNLPGSPITFAIDSTITGLTTIQHGSDTPGDQARLINATADNDFICQESGNGIINLSNDISPFLIFPNPASGEIQVFSNQLSVNSIEIFNLLGEKIYSVPITDNRSPITINIAAFSKGMYFLEVENKNGFAVKKFEKE